MGIPKLTKCCFIFDLKTGTTIIASINAIMTFFMLVTLIVMSTIFSTLQDEVVDDPDPEDEALATGLYVISIMLVLMYLVKFLADLLFIYGVVREHRGIIKAYGIWWFAFFLLSSFVYFLHVTHFHASITIYELSYISLNIYAALLAYNFYVTINEREELSQGGVEMGVSEKNPESYVYQ